jgi:hypothetical protein
VRTALLALALLGSGCNLFGEPTQTTAPCDGDSSCPGGQSCFVDGCGRLGDDLIAEVTSSAPIGVTSVDIPLGHPRAGLLLVLPDSQVLRITARRGTGGYPAPRQLFASGASSLLPGVGRYAQATDATVSGVSPLAVSTGVYSLLVSPEDVSVPPAVLRNVAVDAGINEATVTLLPAAEITTVSGTVLAAPGVPETIPPAVQLVTADGSPLSALVTAGGSGAFQLSFGTALPAGAQLQVVAGSGNRLGGTATFPVADLGRFAQPFVVGDGVPPVVFQGRLLGPDGAPVPGASLFLQGLVAGGAVATVGPVRTSDAGVFQLQTLPQADAGTLMISANPPPGSAAGLLQMTADVPASGGTETTWTSPARALVQGSVRYPDGGPVVAVGVRADPVGVAAPGVPQPPAGADGVTDDNGHFALRLDPALYRLEIGSQDGFPALRSFTRIEVGGSLPEATLITGRTLTAVLRRDGGTAVGQALVRIYRSVVLDDGSSRALLLGEAVSDSTGQVSILLPTR